MGWHAFAHDAASDRGELVVDVGDSLGIDVGADALDGIGTAIGSKEPLEVSRHGGPPNGLSASPVTALPLAHGTCGLKAASSGAGASSRFTDSKPCIMT